MSVQLEWMRYLFRWIDWNTEHIAEHGVSIREAEYVVDHAKRPYPRTIGDGKMLVRGKTREGCFLQVIYVIDRDKTVFVIHARPLTDAEKRRFRR